MIEKKREEVEEEKQGGRESGWTQQKWKREKKVLELKRIKWRGEIRQLESDMWLVVVEIRNCNSRHKEEKRGLVKHKPLEKDEAFTWQ